MKKFLFETGNHWTGLIARVSLGLLILPHGLQKTFGWFGGFGFRGTMQYFTDYIHIPWLLGAFVIFAELIGSLLLVAGITTRIWALVMIAIMTGAVVTEHRANGFFMDWNGQFRGEGYEYHLAIIVISLVVMLNGGGKYAADQLLYREDKGQRGVR